MPQTPQGNAASIGGRTEPGVGIAEWQKGWSWLCRTQPDIHILVAIAGNSIDRAQSLAEGRQALHEQVEIENPDALHIEDPLPPGLLAFEQHTQPRRSRLTPRRGGGRVPPTRALDQLTAPMIQE